MQVFISWSGKRSRAIAEALRDWLPDVLPGTKPWMSGSDIYAGSRWSQEIADILGTCDVGIICLTRDNLRAPWLLFESGAISKAPKASLVCTYLAGISAEQLTGPLSQFQSSIADENGTRKVITAINQQLQQPEPQERVDKRFNAFWPDFQKKITSLPDASADDSQTLASDSDLQSPEQVAHLTQLLGEQYGFMRKKYQVVYEIGADGSAHSVHTEVVRALNDELKAIEHSTTITTEPGNITGAFSVRTEAGKSKSGDVQITKKLALSTPTRLYYQLMFTPPLSAGQTIEYSYEVQGPAGMFALDESELRSRNLPYDYVSLKNSYPSKSLALTVVFPAEIRPVKLDCDVWMGDARLQLKKEFDRMKKVQALRKTWRPDGKLVVEFAVDYPILDVKYAIIWEPGPIA
jgi:hypothetical protein